MIGLDKGTAVFDKCVQDSSLVGHPQWTQNLDSSDISFLQSLQWTNISKSYHKNGWFWTKFYMWKFED